METAYDNPSEVINPFFSSPGFSNIKSLADAGGFHARETLRHSAVLTGRALRYRISPAMAQAGTFDTNLPL